MLDHAELFRADIFAVRDARTKAGHLRFVRGGQAELRGEFANFDFGQASLFERSADLEFRGGSGAGAKITDVAGVFTISDDGETFSSGKRSEFREKFVFAEVATIRRIGQILGIVEFFGANYADGKMKPVRQI